jgi:hypothetical protein
MLPGSGRPGQRPGSAAQPTGPGATVHRSANPCVSSSVVGASCQSRAVRPADSSSIVGRDAERAVTGRRLTEQIAEHGNRAAQRPEAVGFSGRSAGVGVATRLGLRGLWRTVGMARGGTGWCEVMPATDVEPPRLQAMAAQYDDDTIAHLRSGSRARLALPGDRRRRRLDRTLAARPGRWRRGRRDRHRDPLPGRPGGAERRGPPPRHHRGPAAG